MKTGKTDGSGSNARGARAAKQLSLKALAKECSRRDDRAHETLHSRRL
jgi:hypothetical protein